MSRNTNPRRRTMTESPMTPELAAALAALTAADRRQLRVIAPESTTWLRALLLGLVAEVDHLERLESIAKMDEVTILHAHYLDHLQDVEEASAGAVWPSHEDPGPGASWWPLGKPEGLE
jgi:hypothetical protein